MIRPLFFFGLAGLALCGCQSTGTGAVDEVNRLLKAPVRTPVAEAPPGAPEDTCWSKDVTPAVVETVTDHVLVQPAQVDTDGSVRAPATYKTETRQMIVRERKELWFQTPCSADMDGMFVGSLQRALKARKLYHGPITGELDHSTSRAIRRFQAADGLDSPILSMNGARKLGLIAYPIEGYTPPQSQDLPAEPVIIDPAPVESPDNSL